MSTKSISTQWPRGKPSTEIACQPAFSRLVSTDSAIADLRLRYADAPTEDAGDRESTYLHLLVGVLEFNATQELFGQGWARERLGKVPFYTWVYREIRERPEPIRQILKKHGLDSPDART